MRGNNTRGYLFAHNKTDQFRENKYSNFIQLDTIGNVILEFTSYTPANDKIQIRGVDVKRFGLDSSRNHCVVDKDTFLLIKKNLLGAARLIFFLCIYIWVTLMAIQTQMKLHKKHIKEREASVFR